MNDRMGVLPVFIFFPAMNERMWRVVVPGGERTEFAREGQAVAFAFSSAAALKNRGRAVKVFRESQAGHWIHIPLPVS
jgi:hypothetical protein